MEGRRIDVRDLDGRNEGADDEARVSLKLENKSMHFSVISKYESFQIAHFSVIRFGD
jgi:hypothetical protein